jgi:hypothetical protein
MAYERHLLAIVQSKCVARHNFLLDYDDIDDVVVVVAMLDI